MIEELVKRIVDPRFNAPDPVKQERVRIVEEVNVHMKGHYPAALLADWRTDYDKDDIAQVEKIYESVTTELWMDGLNGAVTRIKNSDYVESQIPEAVQEFIDTVVYVRSNRAYSFNDFNTYLFSRAINDPNGYIVYLPKFTLTPDFTANIPDLNRDLEEMSVDIVFVSCKDVVKDPKMFAWEAGMWHYANEDDTNSLNPDGQKKKKEAPYYYAYDTEDLYLIYPTGMKDGLISYKWVSIWEHMYGFIPYDSARGIQSTSIIYEGEKTKRKKEVAINKSYLHSFIPHGNDALLYYIDAKLQLRKCGYPTEIRRGVNCDKCKGKGKVLNEKLTQHMNDGEEHYSNCGHCNGLGLCEPNPNRIIYLPAGSTHSGFGDPIDPKSFSAWIERPVESIKINAEKYNESYEAARNTVMPPRQKNGVEAVEALQIQRERHENFLLTLGNYYWHIKETSLKIIQHFLVPKDKHVVIKIYPARHYEVSTTVEKQEEYRKTKDNGDTYMASVMLNEVVNMRYKNNPVELKLFNVLRLFDPLLNITSKDLIQKKATGIFSVDECRKHDMAPAIIDRIRIERHAEILEMEMDDLLKIAEEIFIATPAPAQLI